MNTAANGVVTQCLYGLHKARAVRRLSSDPDRATGLGARMSLYGFNQHPNRESWLGDVADRLRPVFAQLDAPLPERLRIAIGFPSTGRRAKATG